MNLSSRSALSMFLFCGSLAGPALMAQPTRIHESVFDVLPLKNWSVDTSQYRRVNIEVVREGKSLPIQADAVPSAPGSFIAVTPCRVVDTRNADGAFGGPILASGTTRAFTIPNGPCTGIPTNASAYSLSIGVTQTAAGGYLTAWPTGTSQPGVATATWFGAAQTMSTAAIVPAGTSGSISVFGGATTHMTIDINGYFLEDKNKVFTFSWFSGGLAGLTASATTSGGTLVIEVASSGYRNAADGAGLIGFDVALDGGAVQTAAQAYTNETGSHKAMVTLYVTYYGVAAGSHSFHVTPKALTQRDVGDPFSLRVTEY